MRLKTQHLRLLMSKKLVNLTCSVCNKVTPHFMSMSDDGEFELGRKCADCAMDRLEAILAEVELEYSKFVKKRDTEPS